MFLSWDKNTHIYALRDDSLPVLRDNSGSTSESPMVPLKMVVWKEPVIEGRAKCDQFAHAINTHLQITRSVLYNTEQPLAAVLVGMVNS